MMKGVLVFLIVITIIYLVFSIWNTFITKKQVTMSVIDASYCILLGAFTAMFKYAMVVEIIAVVVVAIWLFLAGTQWNKNYKRKYEE